MPKRTRSLDTSATLMICCRTRCTATCVAMSLGSSVSKWIDWRFAGTFVPLFENFDLKKGESDTERMIILNHSNMAPQKTINNICKSFLHSLPAPKHRDYFNLNYLLLGLRCYSVFILLNEKLTMKTLDFSLAQRCCRGLTPSSSRRSDALWYLHLVKRKRIAGDCSSHRGRPESSRRTYLYITVWVDNPSKNVRNAWLNIRTCLK